MNITELIHSWHKYCEAHQIDNLSCGMATRKLVEMIEEHYSQSYDDLRLPVMIIDMFGVKTNITKIVTDLIIKNNPKYKNVVWLCEDKLKEPT